MDPTPLAAFATLLALVVGGAVTRRVYRAYRRTHWAAMATLGAGFAVLTLATLAGYWASTSLDGADALVVQTGVTVLGLGLVAYSLYRRDDGPADEA